MRLLLYLLNQTTGLRVQSYWIKLSTAALENLLRERNCSRLMKRPGIMLKLQNTSLNKRNR
jgi:hypothetical protein